MRSDDQVKSESTTSPADSNTTAVDGQRSVKKLWQDQAQSNLVLKRSHEHNDANDEATSSTSNDSITNQGDSVSNDGKSQNHKGGDEKKERPKQMQRRRRTTEYQLKRLLEIFETITDTPSFGQRDGIAQELGMTNREVQVWFQNRRAKMAKLRAEALRRENTQRELMFNQLAMHGHIQQQQDIQGVTVAVAIDYATLKQHHLNDPRANYQILSSAANTTGLGLLPSKGNGDGFNSPAALSNFTQRPQSQRYNNATLPAMYVLSAQNERLLSIKQQQQQKNTALGFPVQAGSFGQSSALKQEYTVDSGRVSDFSGSDGKSSVGLSSPFRDIDLQGGQGFGIGRTVDTGLSRQESDDLKLDRTAGLAGVNYSSNLQVSSIQKDQSQMLNVPSNNSSDHQFFLKGVGGHSVSDFIQSPHLSNELPSWFISNNSTTFAVPADASLPSLHVNYQSYRYDSKYKDQKQTNNVVDQSQELESPTDKVLPFFKSKMSNDTNKASDVSMELQKSNAIGHSEKDSAVDHAPSIISNSARPFKKQRYSVSL
ncbi:hypothetical protein MIR68_010361 [Amoeboaphelidium protococcarum]|nr:hypothetical protein MIR68_010361 [Amoeboaphelidium protococcarum]